MTQTSLNLYIHTLIHMVNIVFFHSLIVTFDEEHFFFLFWITLFFGTPSIDPELECYFLLQITFLPPRENALYQN